MFTIQLVFDKFLDKIDKEGSDILGVPQVMELLESTAYDYIEENFKYIENNQQLRDAILPLSKAFSVNLTLNPADDREMLGALPSAYLHLETIDLVVPGKDVREVRVVRRGEIDRNKNNPNAKPTNEYPRVVEYSSYFAAYGLTVYQGVKAKGFIIEKPTMGDASGDLTSEIAINLPDFTVEKLLNMMVVSYKERVNDPSYQQAYIQEQGYGQANK